MKLFFKWKIHRRAKCQVYFPLFFFFFHMSELCKLCMRNILDSSFPPHFCLLGCVVNCMFTLPMLSPSNPHRWEKKKKRKKSRASVAGSCQLYLPPRPFWSPPVWDFTEWRRVMHKHGRTQRDALTHKFTPGKSKELWARQKQTDARNSQNTNPSETHIHPSISWEHILEVCK